MIELNREYADKMRFLAINIAVGDTMESTAQFIKKLPGELTVLYDEKQETASAYEVFATPHIALIDGTGKIVSVDSSISVEDVRSLLGEE